MIMDILRDAEHWWREIVKIATPLDSDKQVVVGDKPRTAADFEAYTDNRRIYINVDEKRFLDDFKKIIVPAYRVAAKKLYNVPEEVPDLELLTNLVFDTFLFVHFHEQLHPWLCPNSETDEARISKALYEGFREAQKSLSEKDAMIRVNNCKNLAWDVVLNVSFISKTAGYADDNLEKKINYVFTKENRQIEYQPVTHYPSGIVPIIYMTSAQNRTTDIPISLIGLMYSTMSYNDPALREKAAEVFLEDLDVKKMKRATALETLKEMYGGFVAELDISQLAKKGIDKNEYLERTERVVDFGNAGYEENQQYLVTALTRIFDTPSMRYKSLKGFAKVLCPYISADQKMGTFDPNTRGRDSGVPGMPMPGGSASGSKSDSNDDDGNGERDSDSKDKKDGKGKGEKGKTQEEMDGDSMSDTLDDLLGSLGEKDVNDLLGDLTKKTTTEENFRKKTKDPRKKPKGSFCDANAGGGYCDGYHSFISVVELTEKVDLATRLAINSMDEYYRRNAVPIELRGQFTTELSLTDIGNKKRWRLKKSDVLTAAQVAKLNFQQIMSFQKKTGLPVIMDIGNGFYKINEYELRETPLKSNVSSRTGIEVPDNWILFVDSSSTMTATKNYVATGNKYDLLMHIVRGIANTLIPLSQAMGKEINFGVVNYSQQTVYCGTDSLAKVFNSKYHPIKHALYAPQSQMTLLDSAVFDLIKKDIKPGKTLYTFITDGEPCCIELEGCGCGGYEIYEGILDACKSGTGVIYLEVRGKEGVLGKYLKKVQPEYANLSMQMVPRIEDIKDKLDEVLIRYNR